MTDALIVGAGPAGSTLAYFLARGGLSVTLLDKAAFPRDKTCGDGLTPRAVRVLREMGALPTVATAAHPIQHSLLVAPDGRGLDLPTSPGDGLPDYALVLPRVQLDDLLRQRAVMAGARFVPRAAAVEVTRTAGRVTGVRVESSRGSHSYEARFTFIATGAATGLLQRSGLLEHQPVFARAARAYYENVNGLGEAFEFFLERTLVPGYGWVFPTSTTTANVGVITHAAGTPTRALLDAFVHSPGVRDRLRHARRIGEPKGYPLRVDFPLTRTTFPGAALVGEAAGLVNPVTGEGIDYALESAQIAAEVFGPVLRDSTEVGDEHLQQYAGALRARFGRMFRLHLQIRELVLRRAWLINLALALAAPRAAARRWLTELAHGERTPTRRELLHTVWQLLTR